MDPPMNEEELQTAKTQAATLREQVLAMPPGVVRSALESTLRSLEETLATQASQPAQPASQPPASDWEMVSDGTPQRSDTATPTLDDADVPLHADGLRGILADLRLCPPVQRASDACFAVLHACVRRSGYVCTGIDSQSMDIPGFAPPVRDLPSGQFLPKEALSGGQRKLKYRSAKDRKDTLTTHFHSAGGGAADGELTVALEARLGGRRSGQQTLRLALSAFLAQEAAQGGTVQTFLSVDHIKVTMEAFEAAFLDAGFFETASLSDPVPAMGQSAALQSAPPPMRVRPPPRPLPGSDSLRVPTRPRPGIPGLQDDPHAFPYPLPGGTGVAVPPPRTGDFRGDLDPNFGGVGGGEGGNLMGPGHPMFHPRPDGTPGLPEARFDPWGPVVGPNRGPRGPPRRGLNPSPDPDHLLPPGGGNMFF